MNAADLVPVTPANQVHKYANDTYIIIPACNVQSRADGLEHIVLWTQTNSLKLTRVKKVKKKKIC